MIVAYLPVIPAAPAVISIRDKKSVGNSPYSSCFRYRQTPLQKTNNSIHLRRYARANGVDAPYANANIQERRTVIIVLSGLKLAISKQRTKRGTQSWSWDLVAPRQKRKY